MLDSCECARDVWDRFGSTIRPEVCRSLLARIQNYPKTVFFQTTLYAPTQLKLNSTQTQMSGDDEEFHDSRSNHLHSRIVAPFKFMNHLQLQAQAEKLELIQNQREELLKEKGFSAGAVRERDSLNQIDRGTTKGALSPS